MSSGLRAFLGAVFGALITLAAHPASRPFVLGAIVRVTPVEVQHTIDQDAESLRPPRDLLGASLWLQLGFQKLDQLGTLDPRELQSLISIAEAAYERDRLNAFWQQSLAVLYSRKGDRQQGLDAWTRAAKADVWKDYQSERLLATQQDLQRQTGALQAWQYAVAFYSRSTSAASLIEGTAKTFLSGLDYDSPEAREIRFATLVNGDLLRLGGRSNAVSIHGSDLVELAAYPSNLTSTPSPKRLWIGQNQLLTAFRKAGEIDRFDRAKNAFSETDGWRALVYGDEAKRNAETPSMLSIITSGSPLATVGITIAGLIAWIIGFAVSQFLGDFTKFPTAGVLGAAAVVSFGVYILSLNAAAALAVALSITFLLFSPRQVRLVETKDLGPLFTFVMLCIAMAASGALALYIFANSSPAIALAPVVGLPQSFYERPSLAGLSAVFLGLVFIVCPLYALVLRLPTPRIVGMGLRRVGAIMALGGLFSTVLLAPLCVFYDRGLCDQLSRMLSNEPVYHLSK
jgi:hypothetical protein